MVIYGWCCIRWVWFIDSLCLKLSSDFIIVWSLHLHDLFEPICNDCMTLFRGCLFIWLIILISTSAVIWSMAGLRLIYHFVLCWRYESHTSIRQVISSTSSSLFQMSIFFSLWICISFWNFHIFNPLNWLCLFLVLFISELLSANCVLEFWDQIPLAWVFPNAVVYAGFISVFFYIMIINQKQLFALNRPSCSLESHKEVFIIMLYSDFFRWHILYSFRYICLWNLWIVLLSLSLIFFCLLFRLQLRLLWGRG